MEFYLFILIVLFCTAFADLIVGVSNDAVNFLNSAVGSKAGSRRVIMIVACLGVLVGTTFSSGIMEVARKGIFNPEYFVMHEVMIIFLAVMLTDIILLDLYNTFALPTSTTVSIVFEILGGAFAVALIKVSAGANNGADVLSYINTENVLTIVSSIGLSIIFAFVFGLTIQFISRLIFTFDYNKTFRKYGALYCGAALCMISYFILVKGAKGSTLISAENAKWIQEHLVQILGISLVVWTIIWQLFLLITKIDVLRIVVLIGTFALALAFAANDLVNFIGAPLGALSAFQIGSATEADPLSMTMEALRNPIKANTWILLLAGAVMVATLWLSRKARSVTRTEVSLGRQEEGAERFESSALSRGIVRMGVTFFETLKRITPARIQVRIRRRLDPQKFRSLHDQEEDPPAFDLLRAAVNLMVASALISFGTSLKLPLSTTFVTFMVAMSTSLADRAWGRESAVYRVNGVITVIGGWFFTAFMAFSACFIFTLFIYYVELPAILILLAMGFYFYFRTARIHRRREAAFETREKKRLIDSEVTDGLTRLMQDIAKLIGASSGVIRLTFDGLIHAQRKHLKTAKSDAEKLREAGDKIVADILHNLRDSTDGNGGIVPRYAQKIGAIQFITSNLNALCEANFSHIDNNHKAPNKSQIKEIAAIQNSVTSIMALAEKSFSEQKFKQVSDLKKTLENLQSATKKYDKNQIKRIKSGKSGTRQSLLFINSLSRAERIAEQTAHLLELFDETTKRSTL